MQFEQTPHQPKSKPKYLVIFVSIITLIICLCVTGSVAFIFYSDMKVDQYIGKPTPIPDQMYVELRTAALHRTASELGLDIDSNSNQPYGIVVDWNIGQATSTIVSFATGDASMYYSTGGGWLGGVGVEKVSSASKEFVVVAGEYVDKLKKVSEYPMPPVGFMRFYIITPQGIYSSGDVDSDKLMKDGVDFSALNDAAQYLIFEISQVSQK